MNLIPSFVRRGRGGRDFSWAGTVHFRNCVDNSKFLPHLTSPYKGEEFMNSSKVCLGVASFNLDQSFVGIHLITFFDVNGFHRAVDRGDHLVFHFHRFDDQDRIACGNFGSFGY